MPQESEPIQRLLHERLWPVIDGKINSSNRVRSYEGYSDFPVGSYISDYSWFFNNKEMEDVLINITSWKKSVTIDELSFKEKIDQMILLVENDLGH